MVPAPGITSLARLQGIKAHTQPLPQHTLHSHFIDLYSMDESSYIYLMNSTHLVKRIVNSGINVFCLFLCPVSESKMSIRCFFGKALPICFGRLWMWVYTEFN